MRRIGTIQKLEKHVKNTTCVHVCVRRSESPRRAADTETTAEECFAPSWSRSNFSNELAARGKPSTLFPRERLAELVGTTNVSTVHDAQHDYGPLAKLPACGEHTQPRDNCTHRILKSVCAVRNASNLQIVPPNCIQFTLPKRIRISRVSQKTSKPRKCAIFGNST